MKFKLIGHFSKIFYHLTPVSLVYDIVIWQPLNCLDSQALSKVIEVLDPVSDLVINVEALLDHFYCANVTVLCLNIDINTL